MLSHFQDAIIAYYNGKTIVCKTKQYGSRTFKNAQNGIVDIEGKPITAYEILAGNWTIKEEEK